MCEFLFFSYKQGECVFLLWSETCWLPHKVFPKWTLFAWSALTPCLDLESLLISRFSSLFFLSFLILAAFKGNRVDLCFSCALTSLVFLFSPHLFFITHPSSSSVSSCRVRHQSNYLEKRRRSRMERNRIMVRKEFWITVDWVHCWPGLQTKTQPPFFPESQLPNCSCFTFCLVLTTNRPPDLWFYLVMLYFPHCWTSLF